MAESKEAVCVTGANGFIGSWLIKSLLDHGYTAIHASVFPGSDPSHLLSLPGAGAARLVVHEADLLDAEAVSRAVEGCAGGGLFHVASPCSLEDPVDPQRELLDPAVKGTLNVLAAAKKFGVRRVVLTSSVSSMLPNPGWPKAKVFDESSWTDIDFCKSRQKWYAVSKTLAEKGAWEFAEKNKLDVVAINPVTCLGKLLQPNLNASSAVLQQLLLGSKDTQEHYWLGVVHVKDVAEAQIRLLETPDASGRYLCTNGIFQFSDFAERVSKLFPEFPIHRRRWIHRWSMFVDDAGNQFWLNINSWIINSCFVQILFDGETQPGLVSCKVAAKRLINLGVVFTPVEDAVGDTVASLREKGFLGQQN